jgi:hypothetical protein
MNIVLKMCNRLAKLNKYLDNSSYDVSWGAVVYDHKLSKPGKEPCMPKWERCLKMLYI